MAAAGTALPPRRPGLRVRHQHAPRHRRFFRPARLRGVTSAAALRGAGKMAGEGGGIRHSRPRGGSRRLSVGRKERFKALAQGFNRPAGTLRTVPVGLCPGLQEAKCAAQSTKLKCNSGPDVEALHSYTGDRHRLPLPLPGLRNSSFITGALERCPPL
ncbi:uncharacterized protein FN964_014159 isoform 1-T1 [Alca torda]